MTRKEAPFYGKDWIDVHSITKDELLYVLDLAKRFKVAISEEDKDKYMLAKDLDLIVASLFYEPSTRTRCSFDVAAMRLGLRSTGFAGIEATSVKKGESLCDTVDMFDSYNLDGIIMRHPLDGAAKCVSEHLKGRIPCFNGGDGKHEHPTQAVLDAFTINEACGRLEDLDIGIAVDAKYGRTTHSLPVILSLFPNNRFHIFTHELLRMPKSVLNFLQAKGIEYHEYYERSDQLREVLPTLDVLYMTRAQKERFSDISEYYKARDMFLFEPSLIGLTKENFCLMHPLPDDKEHPSIDPLLNSHPKYWPKRQAGNGVPTRMAEMALSLGLAGHDFSGKKNVPENYSDVFFVERDPTTRRRQGQLQIRPVRNGTVIDHVERNPYAINKIAQCLDLEGRRNIYRQGVVVPVNPERSNVTKGVLMIQDRYLSDDEVRLVAALAPGATVNDINDGSVVRKRDLSLPDMIDSLPLMHCTNKGCITTPEHHEHVMPKAVKVGTNGGSLVKCFYCDNLMESYELF